MLDIALDSDVRRPVWMGRESRGALAEAIVTLQRNTLLFPSLKTALEQVLTELGVAEARHQMWPERAEIVRRTQGHPVDYLPIRMSREERSAIATVPFLPADLHEQLSP